MPDREYNNILIIKLSSLGDIIHALPCAAALRERFPRAKISWITEPPFAGFLPGQPVLDEILIFDKPRLRANGLGGKLSHLQELGRELKARKFDLVLDLQGLFKSALVAWLTGCPERLGYCEMRELSGLVSRAVCGEYRQAHVIDRYLDVIRHLGGKIEKVSFPLPALETEKREMDQMLQELGIAPEERPVVLAPGTSWPTKCWPVEYYGELAARLTGQGYKVLVVGSKAESPLAAGIIAASPQHTYDLTGRTNLRQLIALFQRIALFVSGDTGPLHLAVAAGAKIIALYGPTNPDRTGPYGSNSIVLRAGEPCAPCFKKQCTTLDCMKSISAAKVFAECMAVLKPTS
ncbi:lipopolysaccharide heptosyltransferase ii [Lucifera butyrica]|uniref:lipopolysaccharide heptosyltransferase II n=2 Tax=Lucifera butyrica TaxID=1351585 RepID=A0A498RGS1_9FIRM|nr:lipopolysaccharide heptosyltransferase ii [Lucifera butyrica]